jgi:hypothetical protein
MKGWESGFGVDPVRKEKATTQFSHNPGCRRSPTLAALSSRLAFARFFEGVSEDPSREGVV